MPWCPQCKSEYQEGFTVCNDCKVPLVEQLEEAKIEFIPFLQSENKEVAEKLVKFFEYSELECELTYDEESELYTISILPEYEEDAKKLYTAFYTVEQERLMQEALEKTAKKTFSEEATDTSGELEDNIELEVDPGQELDVDDNISLDDNVDEEDTYKKSKDSLSYVMKADEYKDLSGTVVIFLLFGIVGIAFILLNIVGILNIIYGWFPNTILGLVFLAFIYVGLSTNKRAKKVRSEIDAENKLTEEINKWLEANITQSFLSSIHNDEISEEANYIRYIDIIKEMLVKEFGPQNLAYLDRLIDDFYTKTFE